MSGPNREVYERYCDAIMGKVPLDDTILDPDIVLHLPDGSTRAGADVYKRDVEELLTAFPGKKVIIEDTLEQGDKLAARIIVESGPNTGAPYLGFGSEETIGRSFRMNEMNVVRVKDGRIAEHWIQADMISMMQQLGLAA